MQRSGRVRRASFRKEGKLPEAGDGKAFTPAHEPVEDIHVMAAFGNDHGSGGFAVAPVSAHEGVGKVPRPHAFIGIEGDDFPDFPAVDDFFRVR